ncbi:uncharacterized membrane protein YbaN (DUF454 family) [Azospirillum fermentarium]|uniref:YbaN family protein n=1 Tax=Azospirillum fermentarium TaxID=1233114 RepID=UPI002226CE25|nr:YbaN family protein [Azospirillum fermentarium]MCW2246137.1 uncharacterized membrane protein YbaN (DUF454 family) [Azospirillum fermentarium]
MSLPWPMRGLYLAVGWVMVMLAVAGAVLPVLPTTPFLLAAAWAFAKASPALDRWLHTHPRFGPFLTDWRNHRAIPRRGKVAAVIGMTVSWLVVLLVSGNPVALAASGLCMACVAVYVVTRPSPPDRVPAE